MGLTTSARNTTASEEFIDVVYLSDKPQMPAEIRRLFRHKKLTFQTLRLDQYNQMRSWSNRIGTVLVDAEGSDIAQDQRLGRILQALERDNLGIVLLTQRVKKPVRSFSLVSSESSFSMANSVDAISMDDLWASINVNLAQRKHQNSGITTKPPGPTSLAERLWEKQPAPPLGNPWNLRGQCERTVAIGWSPSARFPPGSASQQQRTAVGGHLPSGRVGIGRHLRRREN